MAFDAHPNLAISTVATAPAPASSGTSLVVAAGEGARFLTPPCNATVWPSGALPSPANAEIVRVTARTTDTLTITRTQEGTTARAILVGDLIAATVTAKVLTDVEQAFATLNASNLTTGTVPDARLSSNVALENVANVFTVDQELAAAVPKWGWRDTSQGANQQLFRIAAGLQTLSVYALDDAGATVLATPLELRRTGSLAAGADVFEKGRPTALGHWIDGAAYLPAGFTGTYQYALVGRALSWVLYASGPGGSAGLLSVSLPFAPTVQFTTTYQYYVSAWTISQVAFLAGSAAATFYPTGSFPAGSVTLALTLTFPF